MRILISLPVPTPLTPSGRRRRLLAAAIVAPLSFGLGLLAFEIGTPGPDGSSAWWYGGFFLVFGSIMALIEALAQTVMLLIRPKRQAKKKQDDGLSVEVRF